MTIYNYSPYSVSHSAQRQVPQFAGKMNNIAYKAFSNLMDGVTPQSVMLPPVPATTPAGVINYLA